MIARRLLRTAVKAALLNNTRAGAKVDSSRKRPISQQPTDLPTPTELPRIVIYTRSTKSDVFDESPRRYRHDIEVSVEGWVEFEGTAEVDDIIDAFEEEILAAVLVDDTLGGVVNDIKLTGSVNDFADTGDRMIGAVVVTFSADLFTTAPLPGTLELPDITTINTQYNLSGQQPNPADRAETIIEGLEQ